MNKMIGRTASVCPFGCCRDVAPRHRKSERRMLKRRERAAWKRLTY